MKTIILIQHTESEHHVNHHIGAQYEWNLTARGREQAFRIGKWLKREGCDQNWSMFVSPLCIEPLCMKKCFTPVECISPERS